MHHIKAALASVSERMKLPGGAKCDQHTHFSGLWEQTEVPGANPLRQEGLLMCVTPPKLLMLFMDFLAFQNK